MASVTRKKLKQLVSKQKQDLGIIENNTTNIKESMAKEKDLNIKLNIRQLLNFMHSIQISCILQPPQ